MRSFRTFHPEVVESPKGDQVPGLRRPPGGSNISVKVVSGSVEVEGVGVVGSRCPWSGRFPTCSLGQAVPAGAASHATRARATHIDVDRGILITRTLAIRERSLNGIARGIWPLPTGPCRPGLSCLSNRLALFGDYSETIRIRSPGIARAAQRRCLGY